MNEIFGIDMASTDFLSFNLEAGRSRCFNKKQDILRYLKKLPEGAILALESTGGYGKLLADLAVERGFTVYMLQPLWIKRFRESDSGLNKTDAIDAEVIAEYVRWQLTRPRKCKLHPYKPLPEFEAKLQKLARVREGLVGKAASVRLQLLGLGDSLESVQATLSGLRKRVAEVDAEIEQMLDSAQDAKVLETIPGVKAVTISTLPCLRTIPFKNKYALDSYVGLDLVANESGKRTGRRKLSKQGDKRARHALYMAALSATRSHAWKAYYEQLLFEKKLKKVQALVALSRKILHTIYGVYTTQKPFTAPQRG
jgi:transposase